MQFLKSVNALYQKQLYVIEKSIDIIFEINIWKMYRIINVRKQWNHRISISEKASSETRNVVEMYFITTKTN